jgi:hypothetical protein
METDDPLYEQLKHEWLDQYVEVNPQRPELNRFAGKVGRVITVNWNHKAIVDFADGAWYDIAASTDWLKKLNPEDGKKKYDSRVNSAQVIPEKQG